METFYFCTAITIRFCYGSSELKKLNGKISKLSGKFFFKFSEKMSSGKFKKIKNLKFFEWREVKEEVNYSENLASDDLKNT